MPVSFKKSFLANITSAAFHMFTDWKLSHPAGIIKEGSYIIISYPHTSNWDTIIGYFALLGSNIKPAIVVKDTWNLPIVGKLAQAAGIVFIDRDNVDFESIKRQVKDEGRSIVLAIEGTRDKVDKVKKGFYFFAKDLELDIIPTVVDYKNKQLYLMNKIDIKDNNGKTKSISKIMKELRTAYEPIAGTSRHPEKESKIR